MYGNGEPTYAAEWRNLRADLIGESVRTMKGRVGLLRVTNGGRSYAIGEENAGGNSQRRRAMEENRRER